MKGITLKHKQNPALLLIATTLFSLIFFCTGTSNAQRMRMSIDDRVKHLSKQLSLTDVQKDNVKKIFEASDKERNKLFESHDGDRSAVREEMKKIMAGTDEKIQALLTEDQKKAFEKVKKERPQMGAPSGRRNRED
jgi:Spy/CpxP family protein refolding chaperone